MTPRKADTTAAIRTYWQALCASFSDGVITEDEVQSLRIEQRRLGLQPDAVRTVHARVFAGRLAIVAEDNAVTPAEAMLVGHLHASLAALGWAPGSLTDTIGQEES